MRCIPIASPEPTTSWPAIICGGSGRACPKTGHIAIFDRSWYGRVMVERHGGLLFSENRLAAGL